MTYLTLEDEDKPKPKFTPPPWHVSRGSRCYHVASADGTFESACITFAGGEGTSEGNAHLIAAAPALYEELKASAMAVHTIGHYHSPICITFEDCTKERCVKARAALALVDGPQKEAK